MLARHVSTSHAHPAMTVVDLQAEQAAVTETYKNQMLVNINEDCLREAVFEGEYRWHRHPDDKTRGKGSVRIKGRAS